MVNYKDGKIYKITNTVDDAVYVGSTSRQRLCQRWQDHMCSFRDEQHKNMKLYKHMHAIGTEHFSIELIELYPCESKDALHAREGYWIRQLAAQLNSYIAGRTPAQYYQDNKGHVLEHAHQYYEANKEKRNEYSSKYYETHKETVNERGRKYKAANKEKINERNCKYKAANKERRTQKEECDCSAIVCHDDMARHRRSQKHQLYTMFGGLNLICL